MLFRKYLDNRDRAVSENAVLKFGIVCLGVCCVFLSMALFLQRKHTRTILVPPVIKSQLYLTDDKASDEYIRDWVYFLSALAFSYTPASARAQFYDLLRFYAPEVYPSANDAWMNLATDIEKSRVTTMFNIDPGSITINVAKREVTVPGLRSQFQENTPIGTGRTLYLIKYAFRGGRFLITEIAEKANR